MLSHCRGISSVAKTYYSWDLDTSLLRTCGNSAANQRSHIEPEKSDVQAPLILADVIQSDLPTNGRPPDLSGIPDLFFYLRGKKKQPEPNKLTIFIGEKWRYDATLLQTCHSFRFNPDIPIFQYKSRSRSILIPRVKITVFLFCFEIRKTKRLLTLLHVPCLQKAHKVWAKNKFYDRLN